MSMNFKKAVLIFVAIIASQTYAASENDERAAMQEVNTGICMLASQGVYTAATELQAGSSKNKAKKVLKEDLKSISKSFSNAYFVKFIEEAWFNGLDIIYEMPVQKTKADKEAFISQVTEASLVSCLNDMEA